MSIQRKVGVSGDGEIVDGEGVEGLGGLDLRRYGARAADLGQTVGNIENKHNQRAVCWALDLKVAEERVGTEEVESFIDDIGRVGIS